MNKPKDDKSIPRRKFVKNGLGVAAGITITGIAGISLLKEETGRNTENPFEYNIDSFKKIDNQLLKYYEETPIELDYKNYFSICIDENDILYVSVDMKILIFNQNKKLISSFDLNESAYCIESGKNEKLYIGMADHIEVYNKKGEREEVWKSLGNEAIITSLAVDEEFLYAADAGNLIVWKYDKDGNLKGEIGRKDAKKDIPGFIIPSPYFDLAIDSEGFLWAANTGRHSLENYTSEGSLRTSWGKPSMDIEGFAGCCNPSHFVILENGFFVTSEKGIARIKVYNRLGILESVVAGPEEFIEGTVDLDLAVDSKQKIYTLDQKKKAVRIFSRK
jgi:hypothetical protein